MLTAEEITAKITTLLQRMKAIYPTPWPAMDLIRLVSAQAQGKPTCDFLPVLFLDFLPAGWADWFIQAWMYYTLQIYGVDACKEYIAHEEESLRKDTISQLTGWRCALTTHKLALCERYWFPKHGGAR